MIALVVGSLLARPAHALQPVAEFLAHAKSWNPKNRAARATTAQRSAELEISTGALLPNLSATGMYTRNQYEVTTAALIPAGSLPAGISFPNTVIQPQDQWDANVILNVPIINVSNWDRRSVSKADLEMARADEANAEIIVQKGVLRGYYTLLGAEAVLGSAKKNLELSEHNVKLARDRREAGTGSELDVQRAMADGAKVEQSVDRGAAQREQHAARSLFADRPRPRAGGRFPEDDLHEEASLESWTGRVTGVPSVESARANTLTAEQTARSVKSALLPTLSALGEERFTNATAFIGGHSAVYLLQVTLNWRLDTTVFSQLRAQNASVAAARANEDRAKQAAEDAVYKDWQQIRADIDASRSARAQVAATTLAASLAEDRYTNGVATQLDLLQARQDAFSADVARIQADADLAYARTALRLDSGQLAKDGQWNRRGP